MPGRKPIPRPIPNERRILTVWALISLNVIPSPLMLFVSTSGSGSKPFPYSTIILLTPKIPIRTTVMESPLIKYILSNTNLGSASIGEKPTDAKSSPMVAEASPLNILPFEMASTMVIATKHREKYSHGPSINATSATDWLRSAPRIALKNVPTKDATIPIASALPALPFWLIG